MILLQIEKLTKLFGGLTAVSDLDFEVKKGEILGLIGPNGAGKTTIFNCISGIYQPSRGEICFKGEVVSGSKPHVIASKGIGRIFQLTTLYPNFTVQENIKMGIYGKEKHSLWRAIFYPKSLYEDEKKHLEDVLKIIDLLELKEYRNVQAKNLPFGHQRRLSIAIALATHPELLLLDEPMCGMNSQETQDLVVLIQEIREQGVTILIIEHDMKAVMALCDRLVAINYGVKIAEGTSDEIRNNKNVIEAYLGKE